MEELTAFIGRSRISQGRLEGALEGGSGISLGPMNSFSSDRVR